MRTHILRTEEQTKLCGGKDDRNNDGILTKTNSDRSSSVGNGSCSIFSFLVFRKIVLGFIVRR